MMRKLFFSTSPWRAILETFWVNVGLCCLLFILYTRMPGYSRQDVVGFMLAPLSMLWCALRLRLPIGTWRRRSLVEAVVYVSTSAVLTCFLLWFQYTSFISSERSPRTLAGATALVFFMN